MTEKVSKNIFDRLTLEEKGKLPIAYHAVKPVKNEEVIVSTTIEKVKGSTEIAKGYYKCISRLV